jgi:HK97 family phage major capsid protein
METKVTETLEKFAGKVEDLAATANANFERLADRIENLEAQADRPKGATSVSPAQSEYHKTFSEWLRQPHDEHRKTRLSECAHDLSKKDVSISVPSQGGYAVPEEISRQIARRAVDLNPMRQYIRVDQCGTGDYKALLDMSDGTSGWSSETGTRNATDTPTLRERAPTFGEQYALMSTTEWALQDIFFDVQNWLVEGAARQFAAAEGAAIVSGNGSNRPTGFLNTTPVTTADDASPLRNADALQYVPVSDGSPVGFGYDSVVDLVAAVKSEYILDPSCAFFAGRSMIAQLRKIKDEYGQPVWQESMQAGQPSRLLGYPVTAVDAMPAYAPDAHPLAFGAWRQGYLLADRIGLRVLADPYSTPGFIRFYVRRRIGGRILNNDAIKLLKIAAS